MKSVLLKVFAFIIILILALVFRPISTPTEKNTIPITGKVIDVSLTGGPGDIIIQIINDPNTYYINRGIDYGIDLEGLKQALINREATVSYVRHWTPLDPSTTMRHVAEVVVADEVLYTEIKS